MNKSPLLEPLQNSKTSVFDVVAGIIYLNLLFNSQCVCSTALECAFFATAVASRRHYSNNNKNKTFIPFSEKTKGSAPEKLYGNHIKNDFPILTGDIGEVGL